MIKKSFAPLTVVIGIFLSACGGGGDDGSSLSASFPLAAAVKNYATRSNTQQMLIAGTASSAGQVINLGGSGTLSENSGQSSFLGQSATRKNIFITGNISGGGVSVPLSTSSSIYFNSAYKVLGSVLEGEYCETIAHSEIPTTVFPGSSGDWYSMNCWATSSKSWRTGSVRTSWVIEPESSQTAIVKIISRVADMQGGVLQTITSIRMDVNGNITRLKEEGADIIDGVLVSLVINYL